MKGKAVVVTVNDLIRCLMALPEEARNYPIHISAPRDYLSVVRAVTGMEVTHTYDDGSALTDVTMLDPGDVVHRLEQPALLLSFEGACEPVR